MKKSTLFLSLAILAAAALAFAAFRTSLPHRETASSPAWPIPASSLTASSELQPAELKLLFPGEPPRDLAEVTRAVEAKLAADGLPFKLSFTFVDFGQYGNKEWLLDATGETYDIGLTSFSDLAGLVAKKALAPLDEALSRFGREILRNSPTYAMQGVTVGGKIYGIPRVMPIAEFQSFVQIRSDLRVKYGIPEIRKAADMDAYLQAISEHEPGIVPYFYDSGRFLLREYGDVAFLAGNYLNSPVYIDPSDPLLRVRITYDSDFFRNIMGKLHEWQKKGYTPTFVAATEEMPDPEKAFYEGKIAATWSVVMKQTERIDAFKAASPEGELENVYLHPEKPKYLFTGADNILSVFSTSRHVNEAVAFLNWVRSSQENYDLFTYGIRDVNYKLEGDALSYDGIPADKRYVPISWAWDDIRFARFSRYISPEYAAELRNWDLEAVSSPTLGFVPDLSPIKSEMAQLNVVISEYLSKLYDYRTDWDGTMRQFREKLKDAGIDHVAAELQEQFDAFHSANR
ncbi:ABC transporter substrate-binding protein [Cohnella caldifontis]|uniref:ABC transporter substrate-binding protein n=1 Tax=Cohnella caldifontis TaxID=3027471 RepID=UPI0023EDCE9B|nr:ABC transporter substrate-binding protein [Cohnella sp. YIM B05605]